MNDLSVPLDKTTWAETKVFQNADESFRYSIVLPDFLATWDIYAAWERERFISMEKNLKKGDVLFDIGAEYGWQSAVYAQFVGSENMVLIEPSPEYWPGLKAIWEHNGFSGPKGCFAGLVGEDTTKGLKLTSGWPVESQSPDLWKGLTYRYVHEHAHTTPQISIDDYVKKTGIIPAALTMDCEGVELVILQGAEKTLKKHMPIVWASVHPDMMLANYGQTKDELMQFMEKLGYLNKHLATDHEEHYVFWHSEGAINE